MSDEIPKDTQMESIPQSPNEESTGSAKEKHNQRRRYETYQQCLFSGLIRKPQLVTLATFVLRVQLGREKERGKSDND